VRLIDHDPGFISGPVFYRNHKAECTYRRIRLDTNQAVEVHGSCSNPVVDLRLIGIGHHMNRNPRIDIQITRYPWPSAGLATALTAADPDEFKRAAAALLNALASFRQG